MENKPVKKTLVDGLTERERLSLAEAATLALWFMGPEPWKRKDENSARIHVA